MVTQSPYILALDYGTVRTGVAISDASGLIARPLDLIEKANSSDGLATIANMVTDLGVDRVVVGLPLGLSGADTAQTARTRSFADRLRKTLTVPVELYDERFTSQQADWVVAQTGSQTSRDSLAACQLLQAYLEANS